MRRIAGVVVICSSRLQALRPDPSTAATASRFRPPPVAEANPVIDNYFGTKITDNYRWLEDAKSPETRAFIDAGERLHNALSEAGPIRNQAVDDLDPLEHTFPVDRFPSSAPATTSS